MSLRNAVKTGNIQECHQMIEEGADVNETSEIYKEGGPLHIAVIYQNFDICELLIKSGANVNLRNKDHKTPLHFAISNPSLDINVSQLLLRHKADVNSECRFGHTPLVDLIHTRNDHPPFRFNSSENAFKPGWIMKDKLSTKQSSERLSLLFEHHANLNAHCSKRGWAPLHYAVCLNDYDMCLKLIEQDAHVEIQTNKPDPSWTWNTKTDGVNNITPLQFAASKGLIKICQLLIQNGANVHTEDNHGYNALFYAVCGDCTHQPGMRRNDFVNDKLMYSRNANNNYIKSKKVTNQYTQVCKLLIENGCSTRSGASLASNWFSHFYETPSDLKQLFNPGLRLLSKINQFLK